MARIEKILKAARYSLADPDKQRYTDERLLFAISEGQRDIARNTRLLKGELDLPIVVDKQNYALPTDLWLIDRAHFNERVIPLMSFDRMDKNDCGWYTRYGNRIEALVYDNRNMHTLRVYPRPDESYIEVQYSFIGDLALTGTSADLLLTEVAAIRAAAASLVTNTTPTPFVLAPVHLAAQSILNITPPTPQTLGLWGVTTSISNHNTDSVWGVVADIAAPLNTGEWTGTVEFNSPWGLLTDFRVVTGTLHIYYIKDAPEVDLMDDNLLLVSPMFDTALQYYVIGKAFGDDLDTEYQQKSVSAFGLYERELQTIGMPTDFNDGTRAAQWSGVYVGAFSQ